MKKGFTLIELLGIIILISIISLVTYSSITSQLNKSKGQIGEVNQKLIKSAAELYVVENRNTYARREGNVYCVPMQELVDSGMLQGPVLDVNGNEISYSQSIKATYLNGNFSYDITSASECKNGTSIAPRITNISTTTTSSSITVVINATSPNSVITNYYYSLDGINYVSSESNVHTFEGLTANTNFTVYVKVKNHDNYEASARKENVFTSSINAPIYLVSDVGEWKRSKTVSIIYPNGYTNGYKVMDMNDVDITSTKCVGSIVDGWCVTTNSTEVVTMTSNGSIIARTSDGTNTITSASQSVTMIDITGPTVSSVVASNIWGVTEKITVSGEDLESGIFKYALTKTNVAPLEDSDVWQASNEFDVAENTIWYAWIIDNVGNVSISKSVTNSHVCFGIWDLSKNNDKSIYGILKLDGAFLLTGTGETKSFTNESDRLYKDFISEAKSIVIEEGITKIGEKVFQSFTSAKTISIPATLLGIGDNSFAGTTNFNVNGITIANGNTGLKFENNTLFNYDKTKLYIHSKNDATSNYTIPNTVTAITTLAFSDNTNLTTLNVSSAFNIGWNSFNGCTNLTTINSTAGNTTINGTIGDTTISPNAFRYTKITNIKIAKTVTSFSKGGSTYYPFVTNPGIIYYYGSNTAVSDYVANKPNTDLGTYKAIATVSFNSNEGSSVSSIEAVYGETYGAHATFPNDPTRSGYTFDGWYTSISGGTKVISTTSTISGEDHTLYAHWKKSSSSLTVTINPTSYTYDGTAKTPTETVKDGSVTLVKDTDYTVSYSDNTNAGTGTVTITGKGVYNSTTKAYYTGTIDKTFTINKADSSINLIAKSATYTGSAISANQATVTGTTGTVSYVYYTDSTCDTQTPTTTGASAAGKAPVNAGTYYVKATAAANTNYNAVSSGCISHKINKADSSINLIARSATYTGSAISANQATVTGTTGTVSYVYYTDNTCDTQTPTTTGASAAGKAPVNAATYYVKATAAANTNYNTVSSGCISHKINKRPITITANDQSIIQGGSISTGVGQVTYTALGTGVGLLSGHSLDSITLTPSNTSVAGTGTITPSGAVIESSTITNNYSITYANGALNVFGIPTTPTITASDSKLSGAWHTADTTLTFGGSTVTNGTIKYYYGISQSSIDTQASSVLIDSDTASTTYYVKACNDSYSSKTAACSTPATYVMKLDSFRPTAPILTGGSTDWTNQDRVISVSQDSTVGVSGLKQYNCLKKYSLYKSLPYTITGLTKSGNNLIPTSSESTIAFADLDTTGIYMVEVNFASAITESMEIQVYYATGTNEFTEANSKTQTIASGVTSAYINIPTNNYSQLKINIDEVTNLTYTISDIRFRYGTGGEMDIAVNKQCTISGNGVNYVYMQAVSNAGIAGVWSSAQTVRIDKVKPTAPILTGGSTTWTNQNRTISVSQAPTTGLSGVDYYNCVYQYSLYKSLSYTVTGMSASGNTFTTTSTNPTMVFSDLETTGIYQVRVLFAEPITADMTIQVYYATGDNLFSTSNSVTTDVTTGTESVSITIPSDNYSRLRFDIGTVSDLTYTISDIRYLVNVAATYNQCIVSKEGTTYTAMHAISNSGVSGTLSSSQTARIDKTNPTTSPTVKTYKTSSSGTLLSTTNGGTSNVSKTVYTNVAQTYLAFSGGTDNTKGSGVSTYAYATSPTGTKTDATNALFTATTQGITYYVFTKDAAGNYSTVYTAVTVILDNVAPTLSLNVQNLGNYTKSKTATVTLTDTGGSGLVAGAYEINYAWGVGGAPSCEALANVTSVGRTEILVTSDGTMSASVTIGVSGYTGAGVISICNVSAIPDLAGNNSDVSVHAQGAYMDNTAPIVSLNVDSVSYKKTHTYTISISEPNSGLVAGTYTFKYVISNSSGAAQYVCDSTTTKSITVTAGATSASTTISYTAAASGEYYFFLCSPQISDRTENSTVADAFDGETAMYDLDPPEISLDVDSTATLSSHTYSINISDSLSGLKAGIYNFKYSIVNESSISGATQYVCSNGTSKSIIVSTDGDHEATGSISYSPTADGRYYLVICSPSIVDMADNTKSANATLSTSAVYDITLPSISVNSGARYTNSTSVTVTLNKGSFNATKYYLSNSSITTCPAASSSSYVTATIGSATDVNRTLGATNGKKTIYACFANASTTAGPVSDSIILDNTSPVIATNGNPSLEAINSLGSTTIPLKVTDVTSKISSSSFVLSDITFKIGNTTVIPNNSSLNYLSASNGVYSYQLSLSGITETGPLNLYVGSGKVTDRAGNSNIATTISTGVKIDNTSPYRRYMTTNPTSETIGWAIGFASNCASRSTKNSIWPTECTVYENCPSGSGVCSSSWSIDGIDTGETGITAQTRFQCFDSSGLVTGDGRVTFDWSESHEGSSICKSTDDYSKFSFRSVDGAGNIGPALIFKIYSCRNGITYSNGYAVGCE